MEYGYVFPKGITHVETLVALVEDLQSSLPDSVRVTLKLLVDTPSPHWRRRSELSPNFGDGLKDQAAAWA
jgi:hypothetical protein